jgi:hypothetical protein
MHPHVAANDNAIRAQRISAPVLKKTTDAVQIAADLRIAQAHLTFRTEPFAKERAASNIDALSGQRIASRIFE